VNCPYLIYKLRTYCPNFAAVFEYYSGHGSDLEGGSAEVNSLHRVQRYQDVAPQDHVLSTVQMQEWDGEDEDRTDIESC
jgi:hypothetical protein